MAFPSPPLSEAVSPFFTFSLSGHSLPTGGSGRAFRQGNIDPGELLTLERAPRWPAPQEDQEGPGRAPNFLRVCGSGLAHRGPDQNTRRSAPGRRAQPLASRGQTRGGGPARPWKGGGAGTWNRGTPPWGTGGEAGRAAGRALLQEVASRQGLVQIAHEISNSHILVRPNLAGKELQLQQLEPIRRNCSPQGKVKVISEVSSSEGGRTGQSFYIQTKAKPLLSTATA